MAKVLVALLRFSPKQQKELLRKVDEQVNQVSYLTLHLGERFMACLCTVEIFCTEHRLNMKHLAMTIVSLFPAHALAFSKVEMDKSSVRTSRLRRKSLLV